MKINKIFRYAALLLLISANIGCDQLSKSVVRRNIDYHESIPVWNEHIVLTKVENSGAFLSLGATWPTAAKLVVFMALPILALVLAMGWLFVQKYENRTTLFGVCCLIGGGAGNLVDRLLYGSVTDFLYLHFGIFKTGIFNAADLSITLGVCLLIGQYLSNFFRWLPRL